MNDLKNRLFLKYLYFRCKQILRLLNNSLDYSVCLTVASIILYFIKLPDYIYLIIYFTCFSFLNKRRDTKFLAKLFENKSFLMQIQENLIVFAFVTLLIYSKITDFKILIFCFLWAILSPKISFNMDILQLKIIDLLPVHIFEWKSALRKNIFSYLILYILLFLSSYHPFTYIVMLLLVLSSFIEIYKYLEPKELYKSYFQKFSLVEKYKISLKVFNVIIIPPFILFGFINTLYSEFLLLFFPVNLFILEIISRKYKNYSDNRRIIEFNPVLLIILLIKSILIVPSLYSIRNNTQIANKKISVYVSN